MSILNIDLHYFGEVNLYFILNNYTNVVFLPDVWLEKSLHLNRASLIGANGPLLLSVPLVGGRDRKQKLKDVQISYTEPWQRIHWKSIHDSYRKAPWFEDYFEELEKLIKRREKFLIDLNQKTMEWTLKKLKMKVDILAKKLENVVSEDVNKHDQLVNKTDELFPVYQQVFADRHGFIPNLCILDLLLCEGPAAKKYLEKGNRF